MLVWLDADTRIREMSHGAKSLDDFAKLFFGIDNGSYVTRTYTFDDVVAALNQVQPFDWATFLRKRIYDIAPETPKEGFARGGYKLIYTNTPPDWQRATEMSGMTTSFGLSLGFTVSGDGMIGDIWWESPAFKAGITADMRVIAVNGTAFSVPALRTALVAIEKTSEPLHLLVKKGDKVSTVEINYHGGLRYPSLERLPDTTPYLDEIFAPSK